MLRKRNVSEANRTKIGLNAERNVLANWSRTDLRYLGGPWPTQEEDEDVAEAPYHYTVEQVLRNATADDLATLRLLEDRLESVTQFHYQNLYQFGKENRWSEAKEGVFPPVALVKSWERKDQERFELLAGKVREEERRLVERAIPWITAFANQAWRRTLSNAEIEVLKSLYLDSRKRGYSFDSSVKAALMFTLSSPDFLYRVGGQLADKGGTLQRLSGHELASRLAFFLWASLPDAELLELAKAGKLTNPETLRLQAQRMLRDPKAKSLAKDFAGQLWGFSGFAAFENPDDERFSEFTPELREAMLNEVTHFLDDLFRNDRSLTALLDADYTFANRRLARHYGIEDILGDDFRRVPVDQDQRGGLPGMGLFLTKTSLPLRTSPVQRGVWILEQVLGRELPNPPASVEPISEDETNASGQTILQQLEAHRADPGCASCHDKIDPLGIALENFDPIGRWRDTEVNSAIAHDGSHLVGIKGLKAYLTSHQDHVFAHFNRKLLGYALGRSVGPGDRKLLLHMEEALETEGYRLSPLIELIVSSPQFTLNRTATES